MSISESKPITKTMVPSSKDLKVGVKPGSTPSKFGATLEDVEKENEDKEKLLKSEELVSVKLTNPSDHPLDQKKDDENP